MITDIRKDFPMLQQTMHGKPLIYLDSAATAQKPHIVIDTMRDFYQMHYGTVHRAVYGLALHATEQYQAVRYKVQQFLQAAKSEEIIFTRGTTESINLVATSFGKAFVHPGDEIIITAMEHHANLVPWQMLCQERGAHLKVVPMNEKGELCLDSYRQFLNSRTRLVAVTHLSNALGTINPIKEMIDLAHQWDAKVLVDGAQSAPHMPIDVQALDVDFFVFSGHKLYGPTGVGVLYGKEALLEAMPPYQGGGDMIETVTFEKTTYNHLPLKFEAGTPMIAEVIGLGAAIDYVQTIGFHQIHAWESHLLHYATTQLLTIPSLRLIGTSSNKGAIVSFIVEGIHPLDIGTLLDLKGIAIRTGHHCAQPLLRQFGLTSMARVSLAFYNTEQEIDLFVIALKDCLKLL